jgi:hypothetical protein
MTNVFMHVASIQICLQILRKCAGARNNLISLQLSKRKISPIVYYCLADFGSIIVQLMAPGVLTKL